MLKTCSFSMFLRYRHFSVEPAPRAKKSALESIDSALEQIPRQVSAKKNVLDRLLAALEKVSRQVSAARGKSFGFSRQAQRNAPSWSSLI